MGERSGEKRYWWQEEREAATTAGQSETADGEETLCLLRAPKPGDTCPTCGQGTLDYDSLFMLVCDTCGKVADAGCFS